jgi:hypothetical protein
MSKRDQRRYRPPDGPGPDRATRERPGRPSRLSAGSAPPRPAEPSPVLDPYYYQPDSGPNPDWANPEEYAGTEIEVLDALAHGREPRRKTQTDLWRGPRVFVPGHLLNDDNIDDVARGITAAIRHQARRRTEP